MYVLINLSIRGEIDFKFRTISDLNKIFKLSMETVDKIQLTKIIVITKTARSLKVMEDVILQDRLVVIISIRIQDDKKSTNIANN